MTQKMQHFSLKVLTINIHKGFTAFNRRFILPELRDAVRTVSADIVCLQEVMGAHEVHPLHFENWPDTPHYEFLADTMWSDYAYGRNAVYPEGITETRCCPATPLNITKTATFPSGKAKNAACFTAALRRPTSSDPYMSAVFIWAFAKPIVRRS